MREPRYFLRSKEISNALNISFKLLQGDAATHGTNLRESDVETHDSGNGIVMRYRNKKDNSWRCIYVPTVYECEKKVPKGILVRPIIHMSDLALLFCG